MKLTIAVLIALVLIQTATPVVGGGNRRCYRKTQVCCWRYSQCGTTTSKKKFSKLCSHKRCAPSCHKVCHKVRVRSAPRKYCYYSPCHDHCGRRHKICKYKHGRSYYVRKCARKCVKKCHYVHAQCYYYKVYHAKRYCAKARCGKYTTRGHTRKPGSYTRKPVFVKKVFSHREQRKRYRH